MKMSNSIGVFGLEYPGRSCTPARSDISDLTMLSKSPSPVLGYDPRDTSSFLGVTPANTPCTSHRLRMPDGRFISRKRAHTPERSGRKFIPSVVTPDHPRKSRSRQIDSEPPSPTPATPKPWAVGEGGFGTLSTLPKEIRQIIFGFALDVGQPITVRTCCSPDTTRRERNICRKHDASTGKFSVLQISKAINDEASWVLFSQSSLHIKVDHAITPYLHGQTTSVRHLGKSIKQNRKKMALWFAAARFRFITIRVPESTLQYSDPVKFLGQVLEIACLLGNAWESVQMGSTPTSFVNLDLGALFHQMLPFNVASQGDDRCEELFAWICTNYPQMDPDYDQLATECAKLLKKLTCKVGMQRGRAQWKFFAATEVEEKNEGGDYRLWEFQGACEQNGVAFEGKG